jgi:membrane associated rhomboid family serine protease
MIRWGAFPRLWINSRFSLLRNVQTIRSRAYTKGKGKSLVRKQSKSAASPEVWVDPFKSPPPPRADLRVLIRPAIFTAVVLASSEYIAEAFIDRRTEEVRTRAEREAETRWTIWPMIGINIAVFGLWRVFPSLLHRIGAISIPYAPTASQLVVNTFSHQEIWHLVLNQIAFLSFGSIVCDTIGREHFIALYLSAACVSSLASVSVTQFMVSRGAYNASALTRGSLGASGVIYSMLGVSAVIYPDLNVGVLLLPIGIPVKFCFPALCAVDALGVIRHWQRFDHVCHVYPM